MQYVIIKLKGYNFQISENLKNNNVCFCRNQIQIELEEWK